MTPRSSLQNARDLITAQHGVIAPLALSEEELNPQAQDDLSLQAYPLEATSIFDIAYEPEKSDHSIFSFFQDGRQRTVEIGHIPAKHGAHEVVIPVHFYAVGAVILERREKKLSVWTEPIVEAGVLINRSLVPDQAELARFEAVGLRIVDTQAAGGDYYDLRRRALNEAKARRLDVEDRLIAQWRQSPASGSSLLVVDGTLMNFRNENSVERCVGVSKSFGSRYFSVSDHNRILQMHEQQRSWLFRFHSPEDLEDSTRLGARERISWYVRLRQRPHSHPDFGLIRVEISHRHSASAAKIADEVSQSLVSERLPTSYPSPRWHNHLYPICACEEYLSSIMPSISTVRASMKGRNA